MTTRDEVLTEFRCTHPDKVAGVWWAIRDTDAMADEIVRLRALIEAHEEITIAHVGEGCQINPATDHDDDDGYLYTRRAVRQFVRNALAEWEARRWPSAEEGAS